MDDETTSAEGAPTPATEETVTERQVQVLAALAAGETAGETAARLGLSIKTVEMHRRRLYQTLGAKNGHHAIVLGIQRRLITVEIDPLPSTTEADEVTP